MMRKISISWVLPGLTALGVWLMQAPGVPAADAPATPSPAVPAVAAPAAATTPAPTSATKAVAPTDTPVAATPATPAVVSTTSPEAGKTATGDKAATDKTGPRQVKPDQPTTYKRSGICKHIDDIAERYNLPPLFFARLIWQESRFNPNAVSPAGAEGIAQFMPGTAAIWGLDNPYDPAEALEKSAQYLRHLRRKLGNLGLAAAGYNAGSQRVVDWIAGNGYMPLETRNYVQSITGYSIEEWSDGSAQFVEPKVDRKRIASACAQLTETLKQERSERRNRIINVSLNSNDRPGTGRRGSTLVTRTPPPPWGVQLAGSFSRGQAMKQFTSIRKQFGKIIGESRIVMKSSPQEGRGNRVFHRVRVGTASREEAEALCGKLRTAGGACAVMKN